MATKRRQERRGTAAQWISANPVLASGEWGVETDTLYVKLGDGSAAWLDLAYHGGPERETGWRAVGDSLFSVSANLVILARRAREVTLCVDPTMTNSVTPDDLNTIDIPDGFRIRCLGGVVAFPLTLDDGSDNGHLNFYVDPDTGAMTFNMQTISPVVTGTWSWTTDDDWPEDLPGDEYTGGTGGHHGGP